jgi:outer membrane protein
VNPRRGIRPFLSVLLALLMAVPVAAAPQTPGGDTPPPPGALPPMSRPVSFDNSPRVHELIRAGNLYLSLQDALALAIENNLAIELQRFLLPQSDIELQRAKGGGTLRGLNFNLFEAPAGVGGPLSPVVTNAASGRATSGTSVATSALQLNGLGEAQTNLSMAGGIALTNGTAVPVMDPSVTALVNVSHTSQLQVSTGPYGQNALVSTTATMNGGIQQGLSTGGQVGLNMVNNYLSWNATTVPYASYTASSLALNFTQPLRRGFGQSLNRRFIRIATNEQRITSLLFRQQLIATCYGVIRLYTDFVALHEDRNVKQETLALAEKLLSDVDAQVAEGTLAPVERTRASAQVFSTRQDLINATGLLEEQEAILKNVLTRRGNEDPEVRAAHIVPTDALTIPDRDEVRPIQDLIADALANRPDLGQAQLQVENSKISLLGSRSATLPQIDLVGVMQNNGLQGSSNQYYTNPLANLYGGLGGLLGQVLARNYPTYGLGVQMTLPIHNRIAEADLARDELLVKQTEIRVRQLQNQARLEVEDALIAMRRARGSYEAATQARRLQEESLAAEQSKFEVGASTSFFVIQYESLLAQAKSTEVAAKSSYAKARAALERATGSILDAHQVSFDAAVKGKMQ